MPHVSFTTWCPANWNVALKLGQHAVVLVFLEPLFLALFLESRCHWHPSLSHRFEAAAIASRHARTTIVIDGCFLLRFFRHSRMECHQWRNAKDRRSPDGFASCVFAGEYFALPLYPQLACCLFCFMAGHVTAVFPWRYIHQCLLDDIFSSVSLTIFPAVFPWTYVAVVVVRVLASITGRWAKKRKFSGQEQQSGRCVEIKRICIHIVWPGDQSAAPPVSPASYQSQPRVRYRLIAFIAAFWPALFLMSFGTDGCLQNFRCGDFAAGTHDRRAAEGRSRAEEQSSDCDVWKKTRCDLRAGYFNAAPLATRTNFSRTAVEWGRGNPKIKFLHYRSSPAAGPSHCQAQTHFSLLCAGKSPDLCGHVTFAPDCAGVTVLITIPRLTGFVLVDLTPDWSRRRQWEPLFVRAPRFKLLPSETLPSSIFLSALNVSLATQLAADQAWRHRLQSRDRLLNRVRKFARLDFSGCNCLRLP